MAGIEEAFERFQDRLAKQESKKYSEDEEYTPMKKDPYPLKLGPLQLGANANITTGQYSPDEYQNISTMNRNLGVRGKLNIPDTGISLLGSMGDVRSSSKNKLNLPFNPMTGEAEPYSETMRDVYKQSPYSIGAQYNPPGTDQLFSALYNKGGGYNLGYNQGPINVSYTSNPGLGNNIMLRGQYNFADGGLAEGGLANFIKNNVAPEYRLYTRTMVPGLKTGRLDEEYFPDDFKLDLRKQALDKYAKTGELSGIVNEMDQHTSRGKINKLIKYPSTYAALGTYSYEIDPKTLDVKVKDKYDWNPAYGTKGNFTGWIGNEPEKGGRDVDASMLKDYAVNTMKRGIDIPAGLELLGNLLGPRASKGEGVNIDINIPTEFAAMRADTPYAYGGRVNMSEGGLTNTIPPVKGPDSQGVESLFRRRYN